MLINKSRFPYNENQACNEMESDSNTKTIKIQNNQTYPQGILKILFVRFDQQIVPFSIIFGVEVLINKSRFPYNENQACNEMESDSNTKTIKIQNNQTYPQGILKIRLFRVSRMFFIRSRLKKNAPTNFIGNVNR